MIIREQDEHQKEVTSTHLIINWKILHTANFAFNQVFRLNLSDGQYFLADKILRLIPKRRLVALGMWQGKLAIAKLFFSDQHAKRHMEKDEVGVLKLKQNHIPTPTIYYSGVSDDRRIYILIFEYIAQAKSLDEIWRNQQGIYPKKIIEMAIHELATQHVFGVLQNDLHLKNFLLSKRKLYMLDGAEVSLHSPLLSKKLSLENLAIFLAQLGAGVKAQQESLFRFYAKARGWLVKQEDLAFLWARIKNLNVKRSKKFAKKIFRQSTQFSNFHHHQLHGMYDREYAGKELMNFLSHPESAFEDRNAVMLKSGRSATVIKLTLDQRELVIKRYNIKNTWHKLRRAFRHTRAHHSWRLSQKLQLFCVPSAKPVAFIERQVFGLNQQSYYVTEYISHEHLSDFFKRSHLESDAIPNMINRIVALLKSLAALGLSHGDLKLANLLIDRYEQPILIDLDGAQEHFFTAKLKKAWKEDIRRLLRNFDDQILIQKQFETALQYFSVQD